jgi:hypothetical protein
MLIIHIETIFEAINQQYIMNPKLSIINAQTFITIYINHTYKDID